MNVIKIQEITSGKGFNPNEIINSTLDITEKSLLLLNNESTEKLDELIREALESNVKIIITSENCSISNDKVIKVKNYDSVFTDFLNKICPDFQRKNYYGITGTNRKN